MKSSKTKTKLDQTIFLTSKKCKLLLSLAKQQIFQNQSSSEDEDQNEAYSDDQSGNKDEKNTHKTFGELTSKLFH